MEKGSDINQSDKKINLILCGFKAHASIVFSALVKMKHMNIIAVFADENEKFYLDNKNSISVLAKPNHIPVYPPHDLTLETLKTISRESVLDLMLLVEWNGLLGSSIFSFPKLGTFNIHDSLLPEYRGSSPMNWAIINGLTSSGATFYSVTNKADSGPIWAQESFEIKPDDYSSDVLKKVLKTYEIVSIAGINAVLNQKKPTPQNEEKATYCAKRQPNDGLLDFNQDVKTVYNTVRALAPPFPGAFAFYDGVKVKILKASIVEKHYNYVGNIPGTLLNNSKVWVLCGKGILYIEQIHVLSNGKVYSRPEEFFLDKNLRLNQGKELS